MSLCDQCIQGVTHEGTPIGNFETIGGVRVYVSIPANEFDKEKAVLYFPDAFGVDLNNGKLMVDDIARNGFQTYMIDYFEGDPVPADYLTNKTREPKFDTQAWLSRHPQEQTRPIVNALLDHLKAKGVTKFAATGYCFGGRTTFDLAFDKEIKIAVVSHPGMLKPEDLVKFKESGVPLLLNTCEDDFTFPLELQAKADEIIGDGKMEAEGYKRLYFAKNKHGFASRGDMSVPHVRKAKEEAFNATIEWFKKYL